jgi:hypothetical protein
VRLEGLGQSKKLNDLIGNRTRYHPAYSIVVQPSTLPCAPQKRHKSTQIKCRTRNRKYLGVTEMSVARFLYRVVRNKVKSGNAARIGPYLVQVVLVVYDKFHFINDKMKCCTQMVRQRSLSSVPLFAPDLNQVVVNCVTHIGEAWLECRSHKCIMSVKGINQQVPCTEAGLVIQIEYIIYFYKKSPVSHVNEYA